MKRGDRVVVGDTPRLPHLFHLRGRVHLVRDDGWVRVTLDGIMERFDFHPDELEEEGVQDKPARTQFIL